MRPCAEGEALGEPREAWRGAAPAPWGFGFCPLGGLVCLRLSWVPGCNGRGDFWQGGCAALRGKCRALSAIWPQASRCWGRGGRPKVGGTPKGCPSPRTSIESRVIHRFRRFNYLSLNSYLKKTTCSKLLVGAVDNSGKPCVARVFWMWKSRLRDRLHVNAGQITRERGTDCT